MITRLHLNGRLTLGTRIFAEGEGKKYVVSLPHGAFVKVGVNSDLLNVWVVASPKDFARTRGLCGNNDKNAQNDLELREGQILDPPITSANVRPQPFDFCHDWRVEMYSRDSILYGVESHVTRQARSMARDDGDVSHDDGVTFAKYCDCSLGRPHVCGESVDVSKCDMLQGDRQPTLTTTNVLIKTIHLNISHR